MARNAADERGWNEHGAEHERHRDDRPGHLLHGREGRFARLETLLDEPFNIFDYDDRVIDHDANGKHDAEQRKVIEREAENLHDRERADERHGHGEQRNYGGTPGLQEHDNDEHHKQ